MAGIPTVRLYHPDGSQIRVNRDRADFWKKNGWSEEKPDKSKARPNLKAVGKGGGKSDKNGDD